VFQSSEDPPAGERRSAVVESHTMTALDGFTSDLIEVPDTTEAGTTVPIHTRVAGSGQPLLLLHGYPETHAMWDRVAPRLAERYTVVLTDLRGYGRSGKPADDAEHRRYSKRAMAADQAAVMSRLGYERFTVIGHDRGARCAYRMALDEPDRIEGLAVLDIVPTYEVFARIDMASALGYWHWFFLAQPADFPERLIGADPEYFFFTPRGDTVSPATPPFSAEALADYRSAVADPRTIHAMCSDYRAGPSVDYELDAADRGSRRIAAPLLALWGSRGSVGRWYDAAAVWRDWAEQVTAATVDAGHFLPEEAPEDTTAALLGFLRQ
jgi:haloacetate dehalogenase